MEYIIIFHGVYKILRFFLRFLGQNQPQDFLIYDLDLWICGFVDLKPHNNLKLEIVVRSAINLILIYEQG